MQRPSLAARRFYRAFYRWNLIFSHAQRQCPSSAICASAFHSSGLHHDEQTRRDSIRYRRSLTRGSDADHVSLKDLPTTRGKPREHDDNGSQASELKIRRHKRYGPAPEGFERTRLHNIQDRLKRQDARSRAEKQERKPAGTSRGKKGRRPLDRQDVPRAMLEGEVVSAAMKPFRTMAADEYVVRFRSEAGLMLEYAITGDVLQNAQNKYGARLERLRDHTGARIEVQELSKKADEADDGKPQNMVHSVLISGTLEEVAEVYGDLRRNSSDLRADKPEAFANTKQKSSKEKVPPDAAKLYLDGAVQPTTVLPSSDLPFYKSIIRSRTPGSLVVETVVDAQVAARWQVWFGDRLEVLKWRYGCDLTMKPLTSAQGHREGHDEHQPPSEASPSTKYTLLIEGPWESQHSVSGLLNSTRDPLPSGVALQASSFSSNRVASGSTIMRQSPGMDVTLELAVINDDLQRLMAKTEFAYLAQALKLTMTTSYTKLRTGTAKRYSSGQLKIKQDRLESSEAELEGKLITLAGPREALITMRSAIERLMGRVWKSRARDERGKAPNTIAKITPDPRQKTSDGESVAPPAAYRCVAQVTGPETSAVLDSVQQFATAEQLKSSTGCQDVAFTKDAIIAHGSLSNILRFRFDVRRVIEEARRRLRISKINFATRVHASFGATWARVNTLGEADPASSEDVDKTAEDVRLALRPLSHPVVLITAQQPPFDVVEDTIDESPMNDRQPDRDGSEDSAKRSRGITVSSFTTVALRPHPIVSFNIKIPSKTWAAVTASGDLRVHLLTATPRGAAIADTFTRPYETPHGGFSRLEQLGVEVTHYDGTGPPRVSDKLGVFARLRAKLLPEHCTHVGDHMIVVARVTSGRLTEWERGTPSEVDASFWHSIGGLAYAKQGYRNVGAEIGIEGMARLPDDLPDPLSLGENYAEKEVPRTTFKLNVGQRDHGDVEGRPTGNQPAAEPGKEGDFEEAMGAYEELSPAAREEELDYDFGFETPNYGLKRDQRANAATGESGEAREALWGPEDVVREDSIRLTGRRAGPGSDSSAAGNNPDEHRSTPPNAMPTSNRAFSTFARPMALQARSSRHFSTAACIASESSSHIRDIDQLVEPSARNMNVADYLGVPETGRFHSHRARSLVRMNKEARRAEKQLLERSTELTEEDKAELRQKITTNDRIISKKLAWNAAYHLRIMLDKGRVDFKRAQFLESAIEKGQAILLEEATLVRDMYNQGKISFDRLQVVKNRLASDAEVYQTELTRLGQIVDEEGDTGAVFPGANQEGSGHPFDGFGGNR